MSEGDITVRVGSGSIEGTVIGGSQNRASHGGGADPILQEIEALLAVADGFPPAVRDETVSLLEEARTEARAGEGTAARSTLSRLGGWVGAMSAALGANLVAGVIQG